MPNFSAIEISLGELRQDPKTDRQLLAQAENHLETAQRSWAEKDHAEAAHHHYMSEKTVQAIQNDIEIKTLIEQQTQRVKERDEMIERLHSSMKINESKNDKRTTFNHHANTSQLPSTKEQLWGYLVNNNARGTVITLYDLHYDLEQQTLAPQSQKRLLPLLAYLEQRPYRRILIEAHLHRRETESKNQDLSTTHANAVKQALVEHGLQAHRIEARGFGSEVPIASAHSEQSKQLNQRIEIVIEKPLSDR